MGIASETAVGDVSSFGSLSWMGSTIARRWWTGMGVGVGSVSDV